MSAAADAVWPQLHLAEAQIAAVLKLHSPSKHPEELWFEDCEREACEGTCNGHMLTVCDHYLCRGESEDGVAVFVAYPCETACALGVSA